MLRRAGVRLKLLKTASLPFEFSDSFIAEAKKDANSAAPTKLQKGLSYTEGQSAQAPGDAAGRRRYVFQVVCPPQLAKLRKEKSTGANEVAEDWDRYANLQRLLFVFKTESIALELTRFAILHASLPLPQKRRGARCRARRRWRMPIALDPAHLTALQLTPQQARDQGAAVAHRSASAGGQRHCAQSLDGFDGWSCRHFNPGPAHAL